MNVELLHACLRYTHIVLGSTALLLFWVPALTRKGSKAHTTSGQVFCYLSYGVAATAAVSCVWAIFSPLSFTGITRSLDPEETTRLFRGVRFLLSILGTLMFWLVAGTTMGIHVIKHKQDFKVDSAWVRICWLASGLTSLVCGFYGTSIVIGGDFNGVILVLLGLFGVRDSWLNLNLLYRPVPSPLFWLEKHLECMIGAGIAMHTAFFVFGTRRLFGGQLEGPWQLVPWILPTIIGVIAIKMLTGRLRKSSSIDEDKGNGFSA